MKTLTKQQLIKILDQVLDESPVYINVEVEEVNRAARDLPAGVTTLQLGLPGDHSIDDKAIGLLTWTITEGA